MKATYPRRAVLKTAAGALAGATAPFGFLSGLPALSAEEVKVDKNAVRFSPDIEPLVRFLEDTPRERLLEEAGARVKRGTTYREFLTALLLAGVRNIQPRPVGFKFHAVLVVHSAHLASQASPDSDRWLPLFWALDQFKSSQARDVQEGDWTMGEVDEKAVPPPDKAREAFQEAMDRWDEARADVAVTGLARGAGAQEVFDWFCRYGARDFRDIGHKIIYVANSWRALQTIGWRHAEPVLRSLAYALLEHESGNPAERDAEQDRPGRRNLRLLKNIRPGWQAGVISRDAENEMLATLRQGNHEQAADKVVELLNRGVHPRSLWDAFFQSSAGMLMQEPGILSLHSVTTTNATRYAWEHCGNDETRRYLMLQTASFLTMFRALGKGDGGTIISAFEPAERPAAVEEIFADVGSDRLAAARKTLAFLNSGGDPAEFMTTARRLIYMKGTDSHDYKFSSALLEDFARISPEVRNRFLAAGTAWLKGTGAPDNQLIARSRAALQS